VIFDRVTTIMKTFFFGCLFVDLAFVLPEAGYVIVVPGLLLAEGVGEVMWGVNDFGVAVVIAKGSEDGAV
jgi:hypothetical protein